MVSKFNKALRRRERVVPALSQESNTISQVIAEELYFDYNRLVIDNNDKNSLITYEKELLYQRKRIGEIALTLGETLEKAREIFAKNNLEETFTEWYTTLGYNKDQVYLLRGRYRLYLENPSYKDRVQSLSDVEVKEVINKATPPALVFKVLDGEVRTGKGIKEARNHFADANKMVVADTSKTINVKSEKSIQDRIMEINDEIYKHETAIKLLREEMADLVKKL